MRSIALQILLVFAACLAPAQEPPGLGEEAPESLFELQIGDADVDLILEGGWQTGAAAAIGLGTFVDPDGNRIWIFPSTVPGMQSVPFYNSVDLTLSLWLLNRFFFETGISDEFHISSLLFGYNGRPGELVQSVLVGNTAIDMPAFPYLGFGDSSGSIGRDAPGLTATLATEVSRHEFMARLEPSVETTLVYSDGQIITEQSVDSADYVRDRFFVLPDGGLDSLTIYEESPTGSIPGTDGRSYRLVDAGSLLGYSLSDGTVSFNETPSGRVLVHYTVDGVDVGGPGLGTDALYLLSNGLPDPDQPADFSFDAPEPLLEVFGESVDWMALSESERAALAEDFFRVTVDGVDAMVLFEPGRFSPFEREGFYESAQPIDAIPVLRSYSTGPANDTTVSSLTDRIAYLRGPADPRDFKDRYPLATVGIYGPGRDPGESRYEIVFSHGVPTDSIVVDPGYVPGTLTVVRNGSATRDFEVADNGEISFTNPLSPIDNVAVRYRTASADGAGDLLLGFGNTLDISPAASLRAAFGMRWKPVSTSYSSTPGENAGYLVLSAGSTIQPSERLVAEMNAGVSFTASDTTGVLRVNGMNGGVPTIPISPIQLLPAAVPVVDTDESDSTTASEANRGRLIMRDQTSPGFLGERELENYNWPTPAGQIYPYEDGGRTGPYAAVSSDSGPDAFSGNVMVMEYELDDGADWVGGETRLVGAPRDFRTARQVSGQFRLLDGGEDIRIFLQIGALAEDVDGDGTLDAATTVNPAVNFDDPNVGTLSAGPVHQGDRFPTEDLDGDGLLDRELRDLVFNREIELDPSDGEWQRFDLDLSPAESRLLRSTRGARFLIIRTGVGPLSGRVIFSDINVAGSAFAVTAPDGATVAARERSEGLVGGETLATAFPSVSSRLEDAGADPRVLAVEWNGLGSESFELTTHFDPVSSGSYEEFHVYLRGDGSATTVVIELGDQVTPATATVEPGETWTDAVIPLVAGADIDFSKLTLRVSGPDSGSLLVDEVSFWQPSQLAGVIGEISSRWRPDVSFARGNTTIVDGIEIAETITAKSDGFASGLSSAPTGLSGDVRLGARVLGAPLSLSVGGAWGPTNTGFRMAHTVGLPVSLLRISVSEEFSRSYDSFGDALEHALIVAAGPYGPVSIRGRWTRSEDTANSDGDWGLSVSATGTGEQNKKVRGQIELGITEAVDSALTSDPYPAEWLHSYAGLVPQRDADERGGSVGLEFEASSQPLGVTMSADLNSSLHRSDPSLESSADLAVKVPWTFGDRLHLDTTLSRRATVRDPVDVANPIERTLQDLAEQRYVMLSWPVWELLDDGVYTDFIEATAGYSAARYEPSLALRFTRPIRSNLASLLPVSVGLTAKRALERLDDASSDELSLGSELGFAAPNVFGRLGSHPVFTFYDTDEHTVNLAIGLQIEQAGTVGSEFDLDSRSKLIWLSGQSLEFRSSVSGKADPGENGTAADLESLLEWRYRWPRPAPALDGIAILSRFPDATPGLVHEESLDLESVWLGSKSQVARFRHTTSLTLGQTGRVSVYVGAGISVSGGESTVLQGGIQAGVEGALRF